MRPHLYFQKCIVCDEGTTQSESLKQFTTFTTIQKAAQLRSDLQNDKHKAATGRVKSLDSKSPIPVYYHTACNKQYCAIKRPVAKCADSNSTVTPSKKTRSTSCLPITTPKGIIKDNCILCPVHQKRVKGKKSGAYEKLIRVETTASSDEITNAAKRCPHLPQSERVLSLHGDDLIAMEAKYHNSCKKKFIWESGVSHRKSDEYVENPVKKLHETATQNIFQYIDSEVVTKKKPHMINTLMDLYHEEYVAAGGDRVDVTSYTIQSLIKKITSSKHGKNVKISKESNRTGNFIYPSSMDVEDAKALVKEADVHSETVRSAAMKIRSEILGLPKSRMPYPTSIHTVKTASPDIPPLTNLFYSTLLNGVSSKVKQATLRKTNSLASDAVFSTTRGNVRPWKNTALGLGLSSMLGSKTAITILNRNGHTISYDECKRLETEMAYSCTMGDYETPAGLQRKPMLSTG